MESTVIYIADNQYLTYLGLTSVLRSFYGPEASIEQVNTKEVLEYKVRTAKPHLIAIDYSNFDFISAFDLHEIHRLAPQSNILVVSDNKDSKQIKEVLKSGINHYIFKSSAEDDFNDVLVAIEKKRKYICGDLYDILLQKDKKHYEPSENMKLSNSETEIVKLISNGKTTKEIAEIKQLSFHTINTHRKNIFKKLNINNSSELVKYAINSGIINDIDYYI